MQGEVNCPLCAGSHTPKECTGDSTHINVPNLQSTINTIPQRPLMMRTHP